MFHLVLRASRKSPLNKCCFRFLAESAASKTPANNGPLSGVRILDMSRIYAGPFCTMLLSDLGAEVIKVEHPSGGDETRNFGPPFVGGESLYFLSLNRNKKSIAVDLKNPKGRDIVKELALKSDVLIENFVPGKLANFGLDYDSVKSIAPKIIYCSISGFGSTGPYKERPGVDLMGASIGGLLYMTGPEDGEPCTIGVPMTDVCTGLYAHGAIMAALLERSRTGKGQKIDCDLLATQVSILSYVALNYLHAGVEPKRMGSRVPNLCPYEAFQTKDGYLSIACINNKAVSDLCRALNLPDYGQHPKFNVLENRLNNRKEIETEIRKVFLTNTTEHWLKVLEKSNVPHGAVNNMEGVFRDPQVIHKNMVHEVNHPVSGKIKLLGPAITFTETSNHIRSPPPILGQHTDMVLSEILSYSKKHIEDLRSSKIVK